jgi:hypothetical protein
VTITIDTSSKAPPTQVAPPKDTIEEERIDHVISRWKTQIERNSEDFDRSAADLLEAEKFIFRTLDEIKSIEATSKAIKD